MDPHKDLLEKLLKIEAPSRLPEMLEDLKKYSWDCNALVTMERQDIVHLLNLLLQDKLTDEDVYSWADALEIREDIAWPDEEEEAIILSLIISKIATPELEGKITKIKALALIKCLSLPLPMEKDIHAAYAE